MKSLSKLPTEIVPLGLITAPKETNSKEVMALQKSLSEEGLFYPIVLKRASNGTPQPLEIADGKKRVLAASHLKWKEIKAIIVRESVPDTMDKWISLITRLIKDELSDYDIAEAASEMADKHGVKGSEFAKMLGLSIPYAYNLMRWYRSVPSDIRKAWKNTDPLLTQRELERLSHMIEKDALACWKRHQALRTTPDPFVPGKQNGSKPAKIHRRASERELIRLQEAIEVSPLLPSVKELCANILRYVLGVYHEVPGITDYGKLPTILVSAEKRNSL